MIFRKLSTTIFLLLCFYHTAQASTFFEAVNEITANLAKSLLFYCPSPLKSPSSAKTGNLFSDEEDNLVVETSLPRKSIFYIPPTLPERVTTFFDVWHQPSYVRDYNNPLTIDTFQYRLFFNLLEASERRYIYPDFFFNPCSVVDQSYPWSVIELYAAPLPSIAATVESFSLLPRDDPNSKA